MRSSVQTNALHLSFLLILLCLASALFSPLSRRRGALCPFGCDPSDSRYLLRVALAKQQGLSPLHALAHCCSLSHRKEPARSAFSPSAPVWSSHVPPPLQPKCCRRHPPMLVAHPFSAVIKYNLTFHLLSTTALRRLLRRTHHCYHCAATTTKSIILHLAIGAPIKNSTVS